MKKLRQVTACALIGSMLMQQAAYAQPVAEKKVLLNLPEHADKSEFAPYNTFYLATTEAEMDEGKAYLLNIERGGDCQEEASVTLKFSDITAAYDTDYMVRLHDGKLWKKKADVPKDNQSLLDQIQEGVKEGQFEWILTEEELAEAEKIYGDAYEEILGQILASNSNALQKASDSNASDKASDSNASDQASGSNAEEKDPWYDGKLDSTAQPFFEDSALNLATGSNLSLQEAKSILLGETSDRQTLAGGENTVVQALSDFSNQLLTGLHGATIEVPFAAGEKSAQVEIITFDNDLSDGNRMFNVVLMSPSEGYTSSAVSDGIFTICDDEEPETISIGFGSSYYDAESDKVYIDVFREGALNQAVSVGIRSEAVTAVSGKNFAPVRADVFFPFGIEQRTLEIPVQSRGLEEEVSFRLKLATNEEHIQLTLDETEVWIYPSEAGEELDESRRGYAAERADARGLVSDTAQKKYTGKILPSGDGSYQVENTADGIKIKGTRDKHWASIEYKTDSLFAYDGCTFEWKKESAKPNWSRQSIKAWSENSRGLNYLYESDKARWGNERVELRCRMTGMEQIEFWFYRDEVFGVNRTDTAEIKNFQWLYRKFNVNVLPAAETPAFLGEDGKYHADPKAAEVSVEGNTGVKVLLTKPGYNRIAITKKSDKVRLAGLEIVKKASDKNGKRIDLDRFTPDSWSENGNTIILELSNEFLNEFSKQEDAAYITYTKNENTKEIQGNIYIRPIFEYYDSEVVVKDSVETPNSGCITIQRPNESGQVQEHKLSAGNVVKLHKGDQPRFSIQVNEDRKNVLTGSGIYVDSQQGGGRKNDVSVRLLQNGYCFLEKDPLRENRYVIEPVYAFKGNGIRVRIHGEDLKHFADTGIFAKDKSGKYLAPYKVSNNIYEFYPTGDEVMTGAVYPLLADLKDRGYAAVWKNGSNYYAGNSLSHTGRASAAGNLIELYAAENLKTMSVDVGELKYQNRSLRNLSNTEKSLMPAKGASFVMMGQTLMAGEDGKLQPSQAGEAQAYTSVSFDIGTQIYPLLTNGEDQVSRSSKPETLTNVPMYVQYSVLCDSVTQTDEIYLSKQDMQKSRHLLGDLEIDALMYDGPHFENLMVTRNYIGCETVLMQEGVQTDFQVSIRGDGQEYTYYEEGKQIRAKEQVKGVSLLILDKGGKELHSVAMQQDKQSGLWICSEFFAPGKGYFSGDRVYLKMTTDRRTSLNGQNYVYRPVDTGYILYEENAEPKEPQELNFGTLGAYGSLPLIGMFNTTLDLGYVRLGVEALRDDKGTVYGTRLSIGGGVPDKLVSSNHGMGDDHVNYGSKLDQLKNIKQTAKAAWNSITALNDLAKANPDLAKGTAASLGSEQWSLIPNFGFYMDFTMRGAGTDDAGNAMSRGDLQLCGGGVYVGLSGKVGLNSYFLVPVVFIPCYFGTKVEGDIRLQFGAKAKIDLSYNDMTQPDKNLADPKNMKYTGVQTFQANIQIHAGIGIAGVLGVRGLVRSENMFMAAQNYLMDEKNDTGFELAVKIGLEIDALLATIPFTYIIAKTQTGLLQTLAEFEKGDGEESRKIGIETASGSDAERVYELKERTGMPSAWYGTARGRSGFGEMRTWTLQKNGFDRPDGEFLELESGEVIYLFLADDPELPEDERTVLAYSVFDGNEFTIPLKIQSDGKADFSPTLCSVDDHIMIAWMSEGIETQESVNDEAFGTEEVVQQEIYSLYVSKKGLLEQAAVNDTMLGDFDLNAEGAKIERLTNDLFYDSDPVLVHEETTDTVFAFYLKTEEKKGVTDADLIDYVNPMDVGGKTYSTIVYKVYDPNSGWQNGETLGKDADPLLKLFDGQHFLLSSIHDESIQQLDPAITDLNAAAVDSEIFLAYTVDTDQNLDTDADRDIYIQWMYGDGADAEGAEGWTISDPVKITEEGRADSLPQMVIREDVEKKRDDVWLFWLSEGKDIQYFDVDEFERIHINKAAQEEKPDQSEAEDGKELDALYLLSEEEVVREISHKVDISRSDGQEYNLSSFKAAVDRKNNIYLMWVDDAETEEGEFCQELYAMGLVETEGYLEVPEKTETAIQNTIQIWSLPNRLTRANEVIDDPVFMVTDDGRMLTCYNQYKMEVDAEDMENPVKISDYKHQAAVLNPVGSVETKEIIIADNVPMEGQEVEVTVKTVNRGMLTAEDGYSVTVYQETKDGMRKKLESWTGGTTQETLLIPAAEQEHSFIWTIPEQIDGTRLVVESKEIGFDTVHTAESEALAESKVYGLYNIDAHQLEDGSFAVDLELENSGNRESDPGDYILVRFDGPFGSAEDFGVKEEVLGKLEVSLAPGERKTYRIPFAVEEQAFDLYGFIDVNVNVRNHDDSNTEERAIDRCFLYQPVKVTVNGTSEKLVVKEGESLSLEAGFGKSRRFENAEITYISEDSEIFAVGENSLTAHKAGEAALRVYLEGYDSYRTVQVQVLPSKTEEENQNQGDTGHGNSGSSSSQDSGFYRKVATRNENGTLLLTKTDDYRFRKNNGTYAANEWQLVEENWYYFGIDTLAVKGWVQTWSGWYYLDPMTAVMRTGWIYVNGHWYYLHLTLGCMLQGWQLVNGKWYYLDLQNGDMRTGWQLVNGKWYYLDPQNGGMRTGWIQVNGRRYYLNLQNGDLENGTPEIR